MDPAIHKITSGILVEEFKDAEYAVQRMGLTPTKPTEPGTTIGEVRDEKLYYVLTDYARLDGSRQQVGFEVCLLWVWDGDDWKLTSRCGSSAEPSEKHTVVDCTGEDEPLRIICIYRGRNFRINEPV